MKQNALLEVTDRIREVSPVLQIAVSQPATEDNHGGGQGDAPQSQQKLPARAALVAWPLAETDCSSTPITEFLASRQSSSLQ